MTYTKSICLRAVHVAEEKVPKLNREDSGKQQSPLHQISRVYHWAMKTHVRPDEPKAAPVINYRKGLENEYDRNAYENYWPVHVEAVVNKAAEIEPHREAQAKREK